MPVNLLRRGRHRRGDLPDVLEALQDATDAVDGRATPAVVADARTLLGRAGTRMRLSADRTVAALAGSTGSGKSSLFNALLGGFVAETGVRRPTTDEPTAAVWPLPPEDGDPAQAPRAVDAIPLLDWLRVDRRFAVTADADGNPMTGDSPLAGLVLLDLPDHDSLATEHRLTVDRTVELIDLFVWVVDPQKYADAALHERYLRTLARHEALTIVVLNKADRLAPEEVEACRVDLVRLLDEDGMRRARVVVASARTGQGVEDIRTALVEVVKARQAVVDRLLADVHDVADRLRAEVGEHAGARGVDDAELVRGLALAAGVPAVSDAVGSAWRYRATGSVGWPPVRWLRRLRPDPLRRLHLPEPVRTGLGRGGRADPDAVSARVARTSLPAPTPVSGAQADLAIRTHADRAAAGLPPAWQDAVRTAAQSRAADLPDALDQAVARTDLGVGRRPLWWSAVGTVQWLLLLCAVTGLGWLAALAGAAWLRLPEPPVPEVRGVALPTLLLLGGLLAGWLLAVLSRLLVGVGARRRRSKARRALTDAVAAVARRLVVVPVDGEVERHARAAAALRRIPS